MTKKPLWIRIVEALFLPEGWHCQRDGGGKRVKLPPPCDCPSCIPRMEDAPHLKIETQPYPADSAATDRKPWPGSTGVSQEEKVSLAGEVKL